MDMALRVKPVGDSTLRDLREESLMSSKSVSGQRKLGENVDLLKNEKIWTLTKRKYETGPWKAHQFITLELRDRRHAIKGLIQLEFNCGYSSVRPAASLRQH